MERPVTRGKGPPTASGCTQAGAKGLTRRHYSVPMPQSSEGGTYRFESIKRKQVTLIGEGGSEDRLEPSGRISYTAQRTYQKVRTSPESRKGSNVRSAGIERRKATSATSESAPRIAVDRASACSKGGIAGEGEGDPVEE